MTADPASPLSVPQLVLQARQQEIEAARQLARRAELVDVIGQLTHLLQRERGASSIYVASQGQRFAQVREAAVAEACAAQQQLEALFAAHLTPDHGTSPRLLSVMAWVLLGLQALAELREQVARRTVSAHDAVAGYSRVIAGLVELIHLVADAALLPAISRLLVALLHLVQGKEAAGQERAIGALLFASGLCSEAEQQRILHLIDAQDRSLKVFAEFVDTPVREAWETQQLGPGAARLERLRRLLCTTRAEGTLDPQHSDAWFEVTSQRIAELWSLQEDLVKRLREACRAQIALAQQDLLDSEGLLQRLRDNPPAHAHAVARFFDSATPAPDLAGTLAGSDESGSLLTLLQAQALRLAQTESELEAARRALRERKVIERAKGVLMARLGMGEEEAFRALRKTAMDQNRRLLDVAEATLALPDFVFTRLGEAAPATPR